MNLEKFVTAQQSSYNRALEEIKRGQKTSHWMWFIFPQMKGLGKSPTSILYAIDSLEEAEAYLCHELLGKRLVEISNVLYNLEDKNMTDVMGRPDDKKLKSSMTLFSQVKGADPIFGKILEKYFGGNRDQNTIRILME